MVQCLAVLRYCVSCVVVQQTIQLKPRPGTMLSSDLYLLGSAHVIHHSETL